jgi:hypothetical protein
MNTGIKLFVWAASALAMFLVATIGNDNEEPKPVDQYWWDLPTPGEPIVVDAES